MVVCEVIEEVTAPLIVREDLLVHLLAGIEHPDSVTRQIHDG